MPHANNFQHSEYSRAEPKERLSYRELDPGPRPGSPAWLDTMAGHGRRLDQAGVRLVVFVHGVPLGTDLFGAQRLDEVGGLKRGYSRGISGLDALLALLREDTNGLNGPPGWPLPPWTDTPSARRTLDDTVRDAANFTDDYVDSFRKGINRGGARPIHCERYLWSCEHHHVGRARAACLFLEQVRRWADTHQAAPGDRILVQAHGQAGLVLALASNLLDPAPLTGRSRFFQALKQDIDQTRSSPFTVERLEALERELQNGGFLRGAVVDVVTLGTPVRYGWDLDGIGKLFHLVNHRMLRLDGKRWLAKMELPQVTLEMPIAWGGDYVQQLAVAGSDARPATPESQAVNKMLWELLEPWDGFERWLESARRSVRCHNDGHCCLVDYKDSTGSTTARDHYYGHAAYTRLNAMLFNLGEIVDVMYRS